MYMTSRVKKPNSIERLVARVDTMQQRNRLFAFPYAVIKKYGDDEASYLAAILSYYSFLSLFPLLIVGTAVLQIIAQDNPQLQEEFLRNATSYFPAIGGTLADSIRTPSQTGLALAIGLIVTLYGAKGIAAATQFALNHIWAVPRVRRPGFPKSTIRSFGLIGFAGIGFLIAAAVTGDAAASNHGWWTRIVLGLVGFTLLWAVFWGIYVFGSAARKHPVSSISGATFAAAGFTVLHAAGGYIMAHELRTQTGLTAQFAVVLAILFWLYLQAHVFLYGAELSSVRTYRLWPRSINSDPPLSADIKAYKLYRRRETFVHDKSIDRNN